MTPASSTQDNTLRDLPCTTLELDEVWSYVFDVDYAQQFGNGGSENEPNGPLIVGSVASPTYKVVEVSLYL